MAEAPSQPRLYTTFSHFHPEELGWGQLELGLGFSVLVAHFNILTQVLPQEF